jgi:hypothetical protein
MNRAASFVTLVALLMSGAAAGTNFCGSLACNERAPAMTSYSSQWADVGITLGGYSFLSAAFDGQSTWLIPFTFGGGSQIKIVKVDKDTGNMTKMDHWPTPPGGLAFLGAARGGGGSGGYMWIIPFSAPALVRIDIATEAMVEYTGIPGRAGGWDFAGGVSDGTNLWMVPYAGATLVKVRESDGFMTGYTGFAAAGITLGGSYMFVGALFDGTNVWLANHNADSIVKVDPSSGGMTAVNAFAGIGLTFTAGTTGVFWDCVFDGVHAWFIPYDLPGVVKVDPTTNAMTGYTAFPAGYVQPANGAFSGGAFDGQHIWMMPTSSNLIVSVDKDTGAMTGHAKPAGAYVGAAFDGSSVWMAPFNAPGVLKLSPATGTFTPSPTNAATASLTGHLTASPMVTASSAVPPTTSVSHTTTPPPTTTAAPTTAAAPTTTVGSVTTAAPATAVPPTIAATSAAPATSMVPPTTTNAASGGEQSNGEATTTGTSGDSAAQQAGSCAVIGLACWLFILIAMAAAALVAGAVVNAITRKGEAEPKPTGSEVDAQQPADDASAGTEAATQGDVESI